MATAARDRFVVRALGEIAERRGLRHHVAADGWLVRVGDGHRHLEVFGYQLSLNTAVAAALARDKAATTARLAADGLPVVPAELVLRDDRQAWVDGRTTRAAFDDALARVPPPVVVKPNEGTSGGDVHRADDPAAAWAAVRDLLGTEASVVVQHVVTVVSEERWVLLGDEPLLRYAKAPAPGGGSLPMFNLALGATITSWGVDEGSDEDRALATGARRSLGLTVAAVDLLTDDAGRVAVMEVNSGWSFEHLVRVLPAARPDAVAAYAAAVDVALGHRPIAGTR